MLISNKNFNKKNILKKSKINKFLHDKLLYKIQYQPEFLSKIKKVIDDVVEYKHHLLLNTEKLPIINKFTNKFVFQKNSVGKFLEDSRVTDIETGNLKLVNKNPVLNPKLSKFIITTKRAITILEKEKQDTISKNIYLYEVFRELTDGLLVNKFTIANNYKYLLKLPLFKNLINSKIKVRIKKNPRLKLKSSMKKKIFTAADFRIEEELHKELNSVKQYYQENYLTDSNILLSNMDNINKDILKLTLSQLINSNVYLGTNSEYIASSVKPFLLGKRNGFYIINLSYTYIQFKILLNFIISITANRGKILIINEKDLFNLNVWLNYKQIYYCDKGWVGGTLTNYRVVSLCDKFNQRNYALNTLASMKSLPSLVFLVDVNLSMSALFEGYNLHIPISAIVNTDCLYFDSINYPIVGNNQSFECVYLYMNILKNAIRLGMQKEYRKVLQIR